MIELGLSHAIRERFYARRQADEQAAAERAYAAQRAQAEYNARAQQAQQAYTQQWQTFVWHIAAPLVIPDWAKTLGLSWPTTREQAERAFRAMALKAHPDHGGSTAEMTILNLAIRDARKVLK